ncbi:hypothetical protein ACJIZ3_021496 [Penstemon smallii]|uniref:Uncharacterized protein n=1 Tax=Penstemon smallii TaxID=265156 RepID=A0ABD3SLK6_9LAMI
MSNSKARKRDPTLAIMSSRAQKIMDLVRRSGRSQGPTKTPRPQAPSNPSGGSNNPSRDMRAPASQIRNPVRSITDPSIHVSNLIRSSHGTGNHRSSHSRDHGSSTPEAIRSNKRTREDEEAIVRRPGKEPVLEVSSDEEIESTMNSEFHRAGGISIDSSVLEPEDEGKSWKVFQATIFKKDQVNLGKKNLKQNLKKASHDLISVNNILYEGYVLAERAFKDLDKSKKKLKDQFTLAKGYAASCKDAEKKRKEAEDEFHRKDEQLIDTIAKLTTRNADKKIDDMNVKLERLKLESNANYEKGRTEGLKMSARPNREQKLAIAQEFYHSHVYDVLSDMKARVELFGIFYKAWKQCRKLRFLNEHALDPMKNDDCEPFPITENVEGGPSLEEDEYYPIYLEMRDSGATEVNVEAQTLVSDQTIRGQV